MGEKRNGLKRAERAQSRSRSHPRPPAGSGASAGVLVVNILPALEETEFVSREAAGRTRFVDPLSKRTPRKRTCARSNSQLTSDRYRRPTPTIPRSVPRPTVVIPDRIFPLCSSRLNLSRVLRATSALATFFVSTLPVATKQKRGFYLIVPRKNDPV